MCVFCVIMMSCCVVVREERTSKKECEVFFLIDNFFFLETFPSEFMSEECRFFSNNATVGVGLINPHETEVDLRLCNEDVRVKPTSAQYFVRCMWCGLISSSFCRRLHSRVYHLTVQEGGKKNFFQLTKFSFCNFQFHSNIFHLDIKCFRW